MYRWGCTVPLKSLRAGNVDQPRSKAWAPGQEAAMGVSWAVRGPHRETGLGLVSRAGGVRDVGSPPRETGPLCSDTRALHLRYLVFAKHQHPGKRPRRAACAHFRRSVLQNRLFEETLARVSSSSRRQHAGPAPGREPRSQDRVRAAPRPQASPRRCSRAGYCPSRPPRARHTRDQAGNEGPGGSSQS